MKEAFPLNWPTGYKRTPSHQRTWSRFDQTMGKAQKFLRDEVVRIGGSGLIVSTNLRVRQDGGLYAADLDKKMEDPGVAIYFKRKGKDVSLCCDTYLKVWENIYALGRTISALRQIERDGVSDFLDRTFTGFTAIPESIVTAYKPWWEVLGVKETASKEEVKDAYRKLVMQHHPDKGGDAAKFSEIKNAYEQAMLKQNQA